MTRKGIANFIKTNTMTDNELYIHGNNGEGMFIAKFSPYLQAVMKRDNRHFLGNNDIGIYKDSQFSKKVIVIEVETLTSNLYYPYGHELSLEQRAFHSRLKEFKRNPENSFFISQDKSQNHFMLLRISDILSKNMIVEKRTTSLGIKECFIFHKYIPSDKIILDDSKFELIEAYIRKEYESILEGIK